MSADKLQQLVELVDPVIQALQNLALEDLTLEDPAAVQAELERQFPMAGETVQSIRAAMTLGHEEGWLLTKTAGGSIRFTQTAREAG